MVFPACKNELAPEYLDLARKQIEINGATSADLMALRAEYEALTTRDQAALKNKISSITVAARASPHLSISKVLTIQTALAGSAISTIFIDILNNALIPTR